MCATCDTFDTTIEIHSPVQLERILTKVRAAVAEGILVYNSFESDRELIACMTRRHPSAAEDRAKGPKCLVAFAFEKVLPLIGAGQG